MRVCEFDGTETMLSVCPTCNEYKGLAMPEVSFTSNKGNTFTTLGEALNDAFAIMDEARKAYADECVHENLHHTDSSAHLAFCPDCDLEFSCDCDYREGEE